MKLWKLSNGHIFDEAVVAADTPEDAAGVAWAQLSIPLLGTPDPQRVIEAEYLGEAAAHVSEGVVLMCFFSD